MSKASRGIRAQRQRKAASRWQSLTPINKKGRDPRQGRPSEKRTYGIVEAVARSGGPASPYPTSRANPD